MRPAGPTAVRLTTVAVVLALAAPVRAQVDTGDGHPPPRPHLDLPRDALDFAPETRTLRELPPAWRDVERQSAAAFQPTADAVSDRAPAALVVEQLGSFHAAQRAIEAGHGDPTVTMARDPLAELRRRFEEEPAQWQRTEVLVRLGSDGALEAASVVTSSGRRELDKEALRAVRRAVERRRPTVKGPATLRFACDAGVLVPPPMLGLPDGDPRNRGVTAAVRLHFDENTRRVDPQVPLLRRVVTRVRIVDYHSE